jgi:hypothetical protein
MPIHVEEAGDHTGGVLEAVEPGPVAGAGEDLQFGVRQLAHQPLGGFRVPEHLRRPDQEVDRRLDGA